MLYFDSVAFLLSNDLGIPHWMAEGAAKTPQQVAQRFDLSLRAASALLVTLCRLEVVHVFKDDDDSVDEIEYEITPAARVFLSDRASPAVTSPFLDTFKTNFITPEALLQYSRPAEGQDLMSAHLEESDEQVASNARHFMRHMNAQSHSCAVALPAVLGLPGLTAPLTLLDVGGGSAIYPIAAAQSSPHVTGVVYELPAITAITREFIDEAGLAGRVSVVGGDFFTEDPFPTADVVLFANILHDWPDETNLRLLQKAYDCLAPGGRVVISELLLADDVASSSSSATCMNVVMIPWTKGRQYRPKELFRRLGRIGFTGQRVLPLVDDYGLVVATKGP